MTWQLDWPSFTIGVLATWAGAAALVVVLARPARAPRTATPAEQLPAIPRWAAEHRDAALETEPDEFDIELERLIDGEPPA